MTARKASLALFVSLFALTLAEAQDFLKEPFEKWNRNQVTQLINDSAWARNETLAVPLGGKDAGIQGEKEIFNRFTVRFFSARPIREAYVRMMQLLNRYDQMNAEQRGEFDSRFSRALNLDVSDRVIIALDFASNDLETDREIKQFLHTARPEILKQTAFLISQRLGRVQLREYYPPSSDGTGAKFIFPRTVNGKALIEPTDKEARFELVLPLLDRRSNDVRNQRLLVSFSPAKMIYQGQLSY